MPNRGFSLIEIVVVASAIVIVGGVAAVMVGRQVQQSKLQGQLQGFALKVDAARSTARDGLRPVAFSADPSDASRVVISQALIHGTACQRGPVLEQARFSELRISVDPVPGGTGGPPTPVSDDDPSAFCFDGRGLGVTPGRQLNFTANKPAARLKVEERGSIVADGSKTETRVGIALPKIGIVQPKAIGG